MYVPTLSAMPRSKINPVSVCGFHNTSPPPEAHVYSTWAKEDSSCAALGGGMQLADSLRPAGKPSTAAAESVNILPCASNHKSMAVRTSDKQLMILPETVVNMSRVLTDMWNTSGEGNNMCNPFK